MRGNRFRHLCGVSETTCGVPAFVRNGEARRHHVARADEPGSAPVQRSSLECRVHSADSEATFDQGPGPPCRRGPGAGSLRRTRLPLFQVQRKCRDDGPSAALGPSSRIAIAGVRPVVLVQRAASHRGRLRAPRHVPGRVRRLGQRLRLERRTPPTSFDGCRECSDDEPFVCVAMMTPAVLISTRRS